jgi:hypothetical protein
MGKLLALEKGGKKDDVEREIRRLLARKKK